MNGNMTVEHFFKMIDKLKDDCEIDDSKISLLKRVLLNKSTLDFKEIELRLHLCGIKFCNKDSLTDNDSVVGMLLLSDDQISYQSFDDSASNAIVLIKSSIDHKVDHDRPQMVTTMSSLLKSLITRNGFIIFILAFVINILLFTVPIFQMNVFDKVMPNGYAGLLMWMVMAAVSLLAVWFIAKNLLSYITTNHAADVEDLILKEMTKKITRSNYEETTKYRATINKMFDSSKDISSLLSPFTIISFIDLPFVTLFLLIMYYLGGNLVWIPIIGMTIVILISFAMRSTMGSILSELLGLNVNRRLSQSELMINYKQIKLSRLENRYCDQITMPLKGWPRYLLLTSIISNLTSLILFLSLIGVLSFGVMKVVGGVMSTGELVACLIFTGKAVSTSRILPLLLNWSKISNYLSDLATLNKSAQEKNNASIKMDAIKTIDLNKTNCYMEEFKVLSDVNIHCNKDRTTFIFGLPGTGKTTLFNTLSQLHSLREGSILVNDLDVSSFSINEFRQRIHFSPSGYTFLTGTLLHNLILTEKHCVPYEIKDALVRTGMLKRVNALNDGLEHHISGINLPRFSSGESKKLMLARAFLSSADYWVFDEPFDCLDDESSIAIAKQMISFTKERGIGLLLLSNRRKYADMFEDRYTLHNGTLYPMKSSG